MDSINPKIALGVGAAIILIFILMRGNSSDNSSGSHPLTLYTTGLTPQQATELAAIGIQNQTARLQIRTTGNVDMAKIASQNHYIDASADVAKLKINTAGKLGLTELANEKTQIKTSADVAKYLGNLQLQGLKDTNRSRVTVNAQNADVQNRANRYNLFGGIFNTVGSTISNIFGGWF